MALLEDLFASADDKGRAFLAGLMAKMAASPADPDGAMAQADVPSGDLLAHIGGGLASKAVNTARSAITAPRDAYTGDLQVFDPATGHVSDEAMGRAGEMAGISMTGGLGGVARHAGETVLGAGPVRAYHGSPHSFDQFKTSAIGTGEGAQAYGHGLYFAENEGVAKGYRDRLAPQLLDGKMAEDLLAKHSGNRDAALADIAAQEARIPASMRDRAAGMFQTAREMIQGDRPARPGHMYEVNVKADGDHFLDWDKPLSEQHPVVQDAFAKMTAPKTVPSWRPDKKGPMQMGGTNLDPSLTGGEAYRAIAADQAQASAKLAEHGVPGIRYLDAGSRADGDGSRNMVVFNDQMVEILRKYGLAGLAALGAGQGALGSMSGGLSPGPAEQ